MKSRRGLAFRGQLLLQCLLAGVLDDEQHASGVGRGLIRRADTGQRTVGPELTLLEQRPDLTGELGLEKFWCETAERAAQVVDVALEHGEGAVVAGGIHYLRQIDDHGALCAHQHVELREVTMDEADAEHEHDLPDEKGVEFARRVWREVELAKARRRVARSVGDQLHDEGIVEVAVGLRYAHARGDEPIQRVDLGVLPGSLLFPATKARALVHRPCLTTAAYLAALLVDRALLEAALAHVTIELGAAQLRPRTDDIDGGFLATLE